MGTMRNMQGAEVPLSQKENLVHRAVSVLAGSRFSRAVMVGLVAVSLQPTSVGAQETGPLTDTVTDLNCNGEDPAINVTNNSGVLAPNFYQARVENTGQIVGGIALPGQSPQNGGTMNLDSAAEDKHVGVTATDSNGNPIHGKNVYFVDCEPSDDVSDNGNGNSGEVTAPTSTIPTTSTTVELNLPGGSQTTITVPAEAGAVANNNQDKIDSKDTDQPAPAATPISPRTVVRFTG